MTSPSTLTSTRPADRGQGEGFFNEQELMRRPVGESRLPRLELDISDNDILQAVEKCADWLEETRGLWMEK